MDKMLSAIPEGWGVITAEVLDADADLSEENSEKSGGSCGAICGCAFLPQTKRTQWVK
jgi:hypothetical protein